MKHYITPEEHARMQRRRGRQALGLLVAILVIVGFVTVLRAGVGAVANLFDDTAQKQEYEDKLEDVIKGKEFITKEIFREIGGEKRCLIFDTIEMMDHYQPFEGVQK